MKFSAKQWDVTVYIIDVLIVAFIIFIGWLTWYLFRLNRKAEIPFCFSMLLGLRVMFVFRRTAKREKKKAEEMESDTSGVTEISK